MATSAVTTRRRNQKAYERRRAVVDLNNIAPDMPTKDAKLWRRYRFNLLQFLIDCFPHSTGLSPFSEKHRRIITRTQQAILEGGKELRIVFRGFAKSTIAENSAIWAAGYGHRQYFVSIGADSDAAKIALDSIQSEFEKNDHLMQLFPQVCHAARKLEGIAIRACAQHFKGERTNIVWNAERCVLPTIRNFRGSGAIIQCCGMTENVRGLRFKRPDGTQSRPDFVMVDDPQTDESAASPTQCQKRLRKLNKSILRLGGHKTDIACVVNATIIEPDDMIDQLSNHDLYPAWRVEKVPMLETFSKVHDAEWLGNYAEMRSTYDPDDDDDRMRAHQQATRYYKRNRKLMDEGAKATWETCFAENEISAIQHAYNIIIDTSFDAFMSECQNDPLRDTGGLEMLKPDEICKKQSGYLRGQFPPECATLTAFVDVHPGILYWRVWAWEPNYTGYLIDRGEYPEQKRKYFSHNQIRVRLQHLHPGRDVSAMITAGLRAVTRKLLGREWMRSDEVPQNINRMLIDANGEESDAVKSFCRQSEFRALLTPSFGRGIGARSRPMSQWTQYSKKRCGPEWVPTKGRPGEPVGITFDTNYWKTRFHRAFALPPGSQGALYLFKADPSAHRMTADHYWAEVPKEVSSGGRSVYEFGQKPNTDNHIFDCDVGAMVAASREGIDTIQRRRTRKRERISLQAMAERAR